MEIELAELKKSILMYMGAVRQYPYILKEQIEAIEDEFLQYDGAYHYIDRLGYMNFDKAVLDYLATLSFIEYSNILREKDNTLEISFDGKSMNGRYIIIKVTAFDNLHHPTYYILNFAIDGYLESLASEEAKDAVVTITSKKPIFGQPVRFITIIYKNDLSSYEIIEPQFLFKELKDREPVFENLSRKNGIHRHPLVRIRKRVKNEVK